MKTLKLSNSSLSNQSIEIVIPTDKDNLYYEPTDKLHKFDLIQVFYNDGDKRVFTVEEVINEIVPEFLRQIIPFIEDQIDIKRQFVPGEFGHFYNQVLFDSFINGSDVGDVFEYLLFPAIDISVAIYAYKELVYVEIFSVFRDFTEDDSNEEDKTNFKKFMKSYEPIGVMKLDKETLLQWRQQFRDFFELKNDTIPY